MVGRVAETDTARVTTAISIYNLLRTSEIDASRALAFIRGATAGLTTEVNTARTIAPIGGAVLEEPEELVLASTTPGLSLRSATSPLTLSVTVI